MAVLRYLLLIITAICFVAATYEMWKEDLRHLSWLEYGIWIFLVLNFVYLDANTSNRPIWRLFGLIGLWIDATEN